MIETLYVNGCSWTMGAEIEKYPEFDAFLSSIGLKYKEPFDPVHLGLVDANGEIKSTAFDYYDHFNWPGELKRLLDIPNVINDATGGASNARILRTTVNRVLSMSQHERDTTFIVIGWTIADRDEICIDKNWHRFNPAYKFSSTVERNLLDDEDLISKVDNFQDEYISTIFNDYHRIHSYFQNVYLLSNLLENLKIKYYFFNALPTWWGDGPDKVDCNVSIEFPEQIKWHNRHPKIHPIDQTMFQFINQHGLWPVHIGHPGPIAHSAWAVKLARHIEEKQILL